MEATTLKGVTAHLDLRSVEGTKAYGIRGTEWALVKRDADTGAFEPVDRVDSDISSANLDANYGVWVDNEKTSGHLWWKKVERPKDGQVNEDEVVDFKTFREQQTSHVWHRVVGGDELYTFEAAHVKVGTLDGADKTVSMETDWNLHRGDWSRYWEPMSPLAPPNAS